MGNKIITEKDFWMCTGGLMPAPMQTTQLSTKKVGDFKYITVKDTATVSFVDFACKKLMFVMAMLAVAIALVTVATGGMALIAICAAAAAGGAIFGAIVGSLLCGQLAAAARYWMQSKSNLIIQGQQAITGDHKMQCMIFGDIISFAPQIKNWWQALALGGSNFIGEVLKNMMYGAAIGCGAAVVTGGPAVLSQFGLSNIGANWLATWAGQGLILRGLMGAQSMLGAYGNTGTITGGDVVNSAFAMEIGTYHAASNILSGRGTVDDFLGVAMWMMPAPKNNRTVNEEARPTEQNRPTSEETRAEETRTEETRTEEESAQARTTEAEAPAQQGERNAFEDGARIGDRRISDELYSELRDQTPTQAIRDMVNEGVQLPMADPVLPGLQITSRLHADHIVPMDRITRMEGFDTLTREQQLQVLNNRENFTGLSQSANTSKGPKTFEQWTRHQSRGIDVDPVFRQRMIDRARQLEIDLQRQIDEFNRINQQNPPVVPDPE